MRAIPSSKRLAYRAMRGLGHARTEAAQVAGVSLSTARRLDARQPAACALCGRSLDNRKDT